MRFAVIAILLSACGGGSTPADAPVADPCDDCTANEVCVQKWDGTCSNGPIECVAKTVDCPQNVCTEACETAYCGPSTSPYQCTTRVGCPDDSPTAFRCYGF